MQKLHKPGCARLTPLESGLAARIGCPTGGAFDPIFRCGDAEVSRFPPIFSLLGPGTLNASEWHLGGN